MLRVLIPSCNDDLLHGCFESMEKMQHGSVSAVVVGDNGLSFEFRQQWAQATYLPVPHNPFIINQAFNACMEFDQSSDSLLTNDDIEILTPDWLTRCESLMTDWPSDYGLLNLCEPTTESTYRRSAGDVPIEAPSTLSFVATIIPRTIRDRLGPLDQEYVGYGFDDTDYFLRVLHAGYRAGITGAAMVRHAGTVAYRRDLGGWSGVQERCGLNYDRFHAKWGIEPDPNREMKFIPTAAHFRREGCSCR